jgi:hypothetical protein
LDNEPTFTPLEGYENYDPIFTPPDGYTNNAFIDDLPTPPAPSRRRNRGGQAGNHNAVKHGFYSRFYRKAELTDVSSVEPLNLADEIEIMRVYIRRTIESDTGNHDLRESMDLMRILCLASYTLTRLIRTQQIVSPPQDFATQVRKSMGSVLDDWRNRGDEANNSPLSGWQPDQVK